mgnify:CR=1 FL=1
MANTLIIKLKALFLCISISLYISHNSKSPTKYYQPSVSFEQGLNQKEEAYKILNNKCNICHKNKDIYKQVFIKKRMPKGKDIKLTTEEYSKLLTWIANN